MILLTFDDCQILDWASLLPIMLRGGVRATFYVSNQATIDSDGWARLSDLRAAGNSIQYHGLNHVYAEQVRDWDEYLKTEIDCGMKMMADHGFDCTHFAYPYGHYSEESHIRLLPVFKTLRTLAANGPLGYGRIWGAWDWESGKYDDKINIPAGPGEVTPIVAHAVKAQKILDLAYRRGDGFVTVEDLKWPL